MIFNHIFMIPSESFQSFGASETPLSLFVRLRLRDFSALQRLNSFNAKLHSKFFSDEHFPSLSMEAVYAFEFSNKFHIFMRLDKAS